MRSSALRLCVRLGSRYTSSTRPLHTSPVMAEEYIEQLKKENPYYDKYADKIAKLQAAAPEKLESLVEVRKQKEREAAAHSAAQARPFSTVQQPKPSQTSSTVVKPKRLNDVIKLDLIQDKSAEEIGKIWTEYFSTKDSVSAVIPADQYTHLVENSRKFPTFLFPLPRDQGYEFIVAQFAGNEAHFTPLINYQAYKEDAPECMSMVHYDELAEEKGVVLMVAEYDRNTLNASEAQCLANEVQLYYCRPSERRRALLEKFTNQPDQFRYQDLIQTLETVQM